MTLPAETERCGGSFYTNNLRERKPIPHCFDCLRRTDPPHEYQVWIAPPEHPAECSMKVVAPVVVDAGFFEKIMRRRA